MTADTIVQTLVMKTHQITMALAFFTTKSSGVTERKEGSSSSGKVFTTLTATKGTAINAVNTAVRSGREGTSAARTNTQRESPTTNSRKTEPWAIPTKRP